MITFLLLLFVAPVAIWLLSGLLGSLSITLGMLTLAMGWSLIASICLGPWVFVVGLLWVIIARINYCPSTN